ncbi:MAG: HAD-IC family P-type ATPase [Bacilli bacterium]|nr:HAD-IC family P-type ATPase [Bacilli bacterium]
MKTIDINKGLTNIEVEERKKKGLINFDNTPKTKTIKEIIKSNVFTYFNFLNIFLGLAILISGILSGRILYSLKNCLFMGVIFCNTVISIIQEIISKKIIDKLELLSSSKALVIRDGIKQEIEKDEIVLNDIIALKSGNQVLCDSIINDGCVEVNESFITGEADTITKNIGDELLSGSFITSGSCISEVIRVGDDNFVNKTLKDAKYIKENNSVILNSFEKIVRFLGFLIIPLGILLFLNQFIVLKTSISDSIINTVAALIGMIPEGLVLLTSSVMAVSVIRLSRYKVLVQQLYCIETLSRVNTICLDKTGTITTGNMTLYDIIPNKISKNEFKEIINKIVNTLDDDSSTFKAIREKYKDNKKYIITDKIAFSSARKFSAVSIKDDASYYIGAYEYLIRDKETHPLIINYQEDYRILTVCKSKDSLKDKPENLEILGFILIEDEIRSDASDTLCFFKDQGVEVKIISGDNHKTVLNIVKRVNAIDELKEIDASGFETLTDAELEQNVLEYNIFGRVTPIGKKKIILALKRLGKTVAMTGDGVNDVLALKEADCSIAVASGTDAARSVAQIVLLNNEFSSMPKIVEEGRRTINNIERSASLLLVKTIYTILIILTCLFTQSEYFFIPIQLTLITTTTIGIPSFILALEANKNIVSGNFILKIFKNSIPAGVTVFLDIVIILLFKYAFNLPDEIVNALAVLLTGTTGFIHLYRISKPFNLLRTSLFIILLSGFIYGIMFQNQFFNLVAFNLKIALIFFLLIVFSVNSYDLIHKFLNLIVKVRDTIFHKEKNI